MKLIVPFNPTKYDPTQSVGNLPVGKHPVIIESSEVKPNKNNDGGYLQLDLRVIDGPLTGATGAYRLHIYHNNAQTSEIANCKLSAVCHAVGVFQGPFDDSDVLHNIPFIVEVGPQKDTQYTEVKKVFDIKGNEPKRGNVSQQPQQPQQPPAAWGGQQHTGDKPAWGGEKPQQPPAAWGGQQPQQTSDKPAWARK